MLAREIIVVVVVAFVVIAAAVMVREHNLERSSVIADVRRVVDAQFAFEQSEHQSIMALAQYQDVQDINGRVLADRVDALEQRPTLNVLGWCATAGSNGTVAATCNLGVN